MVEQTRAETLEKGKVYFFYRPRVEEDSPESRDDVQRLYMVLRAEDPRRSYRLTVLGRKRLPDATSGGSSRNWGFVDMVRKEPGSIRRELAERRYRTKTRGMRRVPAARPLGQGIYRIVRHDDHTHLTYVLQMPREADEPQQAFRLEPQASYIVTVKNPEASSPAEAGLSEKRRAKLPRYLMARFRGRRFAALDPPGFLDKQGTEFVLVGASDDLEEELGIRLEPESESAASADLVRDLGIARDEWPIAPLFEGRWE